VAERALLPLIGPVGEPRLEAVPGVPGTFSGVMAWRQDLTDKFFELYAMVWTGGVLDVRIKDLARMKIARTVGCRICQNTRFKVAEGATVEHDYDEIDNIETSSYTDREKAALRYVQAFAANAALVTDEIVEDLRRYYSPAEIVELTILTALAGGFGSINVALNIAPDDEELHVFDFADPVS